MGPPESPNAPDRGYELESEELPTVALPGTVMISTSLDDAIDRIADDLVIHAENCVREFGDFHVALSGDPIFQRVYWRLMVDPAYRWLPWRRTHLWLTHEHCVGFDDERSCAGLIGGLIGDHADIPPEQFHPIFAHSETAVTDYEQQLRETLGWREKGQDRLDYVLLGVDRDGGTAGLRPSEHEVERTALMQRCAADNGAPEVITMTSAFMNAARFVAILLPELEGEFVQRVNDDRAAGAAMPINHIQPLEGEMRWYVDAGNGEV